MATTWDSFKRQKVLCFFPSAAILLVCNDNVMAWKERGGEADVTVLGNIRT